MRNDIVVTEVGQQYAAAHAAHYGSKDLREALTLYKALLAAHPDTTEAAYSRSQIQNIAKAAVSDQTLSDAHVDVAMAHLEHGDRPDVRPVAVESPSQRPGPVPSSSRAVRQAGAHQALVLLLGLCLLPAVAAAQSDVTEVPENAHAQRYRSGGEWECDWGYRTAGQSCEPITVPAHAHLDAFGGRWDCDRGYRKVNEACAAVEVPRHAFLNSSGNGWQCERGYQRNDQSCVVVLIPADAYLSSSGDSWECARGFGRSGASCVELVVPTNAHIGYSDNAWMCNPGYRRRGDTCTPVEQ